MKINISSFYSEPELEFQISYKVYQLIQSLLESQLENYKLDLNNNKDNNKDITLALDVSTGKSIAKIAIKGPDYDKRNKFLNYGVWLPYKPINESQNYLDTFLEYFFDALLILFSRYDVEEKVIISIKYLVKEKVINNDEYNFDDEYLPPLDLSDLDL
ncbi:MAG: hypothetical protein ACOCXH_10850 [Cyclobacteriaceae bacterium]